MNQFASSIQSQADGVCIRLAGPFDFHARKTFSAATADALARPGARQIILDLAEVGYIDSAALGMLMLLRDRADAAGKRVVLRRAGDTVRRILDIARFERLFAIE